MLTRRRFLHGSLCTVGAGASLLFFPSACGSSGTTSTMTDPNEPACTVATSTVDAGHSHEICVAANDLDAPPAQGAIYTTSHDAGHTHEVALSAAHLEAIRTGETAVVQSSVADGHSHSFSIRRGATLRVRTE